MIRRWFGAQWEATSTNEVCDE